MDIRRVFGLNMRRLRTASGTSQEALSVKMGVDRAHVSSMERGLQNVTLTTLWQASQALGVMPMHLLDEAVVKVQGGPNAKVPRKPRTRPSG